jgi:hypothetical protein
VACCHGCNQRKGAALLRDLGWRLRTVPREPSARELGIMLGLNQVGRARVQGIGIPFPRGLRGGGALTARGLAAD